MYMKEIKVINLENSTVEEYEKYKIRETVRIILLDNDNKIATVNISKEGFHQLIGGGIEEGENNKSALERESLEEAGVDIEIVSELGKVVEIKKEKKQVQNSYCYVGKVVGEKGSPNFNEEEIKQRGFKTEWLELDELIKIFKKEGYSCILGQYAYERDLAILEEYKKNLK